MLTPVTMFRGLLKLVAVVVAAATVGTGVGIGLSKLSGKDDSAASIGSAAVETATTSASAYA